MIFICIFWTASVMAMTSGTAEGYLDARRRAAVVILRISFISSIAPGSDSGGAGEAPTEVSTDGAVDAPDVKLPASGDCCSLGGGDKAMVRPSFEHLWRCLGSS